MVQAMSIKLMTLVWDLDLDDSKKIVLLALADAANDEGFCWPGIASLCRKVSKSERTVQGAIQGLIEQKHITRREIPGKGCTYTVHPRSICAPAEIAPPQRLRDTPAAAAGKPSINRNTSGAKAPSVSRAVDDLTDGFRTDCVAWAIDKMGWGSGMADAEFERFADNARQHGRKYIDWMAAWRNWCRSPYCKTKSADDRVAYRKEPLRV